MSASKKVTFEEYAAMVYPALIMPADDSGYVVTYPDLPGVVAYGETKEKALDNAEELRLAWIDSRLERGWPVPVPGELASCNGKLSLRIPKSLHRRLKLRAKAESVSLNQLTAHILSSSV